MKDALGWHRIDDYVVAAMIMMPTYHPIGGSSWPVYARDPASMISGRARTGKGRWAIAARPAASEALRPNAGTGRKLLPAGAGGCWLTIGHLPTLNPSHGDAPTPRAWPAASSHAAAAAHDRVPLRKRRGRLDGNTWWLVDDGWESGRRELGGCIERPQRC